MTEPYYEIGIKQLAEMTGVSEMTKMSSEFIITRICGKDAFSLLQYPVRLNAYAVVYCIKGFFDVDINVRTFRVCENTLLLYSPGNTIHISESELDNLKDSEAVLVVCTKDFLQAGNVNFNGMFENSVKLLSNPCITIDSEGKHILSDYYNLISDLYKTNLLGTEKAIGSIGTSLMCLLGNIWNDEQSRLSSAKPVQSRSQAKFEEFLSLVSENFLTQKGVGFYADKMYMSPKYLTTMVKNVSGKTATDWIDTFLVLEAKNLLRYSDMTIKEIGYRLNFLSIPSFHKFFKTQTGITPNEFRSLKTE